MIKFPWLQALLPGYSEGSTGLLNSRQEGKASFLGAHLLCCCCCCFSSQGTFLCSGKQELCARRSPHLRGQGGRGGQTRQLALARQELTEKPASLLSNSEFLSQVRVQIPFARSKASLFLVGSSFLEAHLGKKEGDIGAARLRGTAL